jgi:N-acetylneuraminate synthase
MGLGAAVAAVAHGATVIEKHFTLSRADGGVDSAFSLEPHELATLVIETERAWQSLGTVAYGPTERERQSLVFRRLLYVAMDIQTGEPFTRENVRAIRPGNGLPPKYLDTVLGLRAGRPLKKGTPLSWKDVS